MGFLMSVGPLQQELSRPACDVLLMRFYYQLLDTQVNAPLKQGDSADQHHVLSLKITLHYSVGHCLHVSRFLFSHPGLLDGNTLPGAPS